MPKAPRDKMRKLTMKKRGCASGVNGNVGVAACMIVRGTGEVGDVTIRVRIAAMWVRDKTVALGGIVEREENCVQGLRCQRNDKSNV